MIKKADGWVWHLGSRDLVSDPGKSVVLETCYFLRTTCIIRSLSRGEMLTMLRRWFIESKGEVNVSLSVWCEGRNALFCCISHER